MLHVERDRDLITIKSDGARRIGYLVAAPAFAPQAVRAVRDLFDLHGWDEKADRETLERNFDRLRVRVSKTFALACGRRDHGGYDFPAGDAARQQLIGLYHGTPVTLRERLHRELTRSLPIGDQFDWAVWEQVPDYFLSLADLELRERLQARTIAEGAWVKAEIRVDAGAEQKRVASWLAERLSGKFDLFGPA